MSSQDASTFGAVAEDLIYADFYSQYAGGGPTELFRDANNPAAYLYFLAVNNPHFTQALQERYYRELRVAGLGWKIPDFMVHKAGERAFYEVKPDSRTGLIAGMEKVGILSATYTHFRLPYRPGRRFTPRDHVVANYGSILRVTLRVRRVIEGLILYRLCVDSERLLELAVLAALLRLVVNEINRQRGRGQFRPVDLEPVFRRQENLEQLARLLGLGAAAGAGVLVVRATWRHFWKAVIRRFAVRGTAAAALSVADGPLPFGELVSVGLALWTVIDIIRYSSELWRDAEGIARQEA